MAERVAVRCRSQRLWGSRVYGPTGTVYSIHAKTGQLHETEGTALVPATDAGVRFADDLTEFRGQPGYKVAGETEPAPEAPQLPPPPAAPEGGSAEKDEDTAAVELPHPKSDTIEDWLAWARTNGIALSPDQKEARKAELVDTITDLAIDRGIVTAD